MSYLIDVVNGSERGVGGMVLRGVGSLAEPAYAAAMMVRNRLYDMGSLASAGLGRTTISVGNITTGGTGKTPVVEWLSRRLRDEGRHVAILARGYKSAPGELGDEQLMLDRTLNGAGLARVELICNPDRKAAADAALRADSSIEIFVLDDGFQHLRVRREMDIVLLNGPEPFGFGHVLPRGLLREPLKGLSRADAIVLTHCDQIERDGIAAIKATLGRWCPGTPVFRTVHEHVELLEVHSRETRQIEGLQAAPFFAFAGIGDPVRLEQQLDKYGKAFRGHFWFSDHHRYSAKDLAALDDSARRTGAQMLVTTEKDMAKITRLSLGSVKTQILAIRMKLRFLDGDEQRLWERVKTLADASGRA